MRMRLGFAFQENLYNLVKELSSENIASVPEYDSEELLIIVKVNRGFDRQNRPGGRNKDAGAAIFNRKRDAIGRHPGPAGMGMLNVLKIMFISQQIFSK